MAWLTARNILVASAIFNSVFKCSRRNHVESGRYNAYLYIAALGSLSRAADPVGIVTIIDSTAEFEPARATNARLQPPAVSEILLPLLIPEVSACKPPEYKSLELDQASDDHGQSAAAKEARKNSAYDLELHTQ